MKLQLNDSFSYEFSISQENVQKFAELSGDTNPIHIDAEYAKKTIFKRPIIHGYLGSSVFSKVLGTMFPGEGTIYLSQSLKFHLPMYTDKIYKADFFVTDIDSEKHRANIKTTIRLASDQCIITSGEALIQNESFL